MSRLTERYVQNKALEFLSEHYQNTYDCPPGFARKEVRTTKEKRADGLLCLCTSKHPNHTISLEAKSHKTLNSLLPFWDDNRLGLHFLLVTLLITAGVLYYLQEMPWYWLLLLAIATFTTAGFLFMVTVTLLEPKGYKSINVIKQVKHYPANEKWIAISVDSVNLSDLKENAFHMKTNAEILVSQCRRKGIGLLLVNSREVKIEVLPKFRKGEFLQHYCIEKEIRGVLATATS